MKRFRLRQIITWLCAATGTVAVGLALAWAAFPLPLAKLRNYPASTVILDRDGLPLRVTRSEGGTFCLPVRLAQTGPWIGKAMVAAEDKRFFGHCGFDVLATARAAVQNLASQRVVSGASTISTQVIRLAEPRPRTWRTKFIEVFRALQMERLLPKEEILECYLNRAPFGSNLIGVEAASRYYFGKSAADLSLGEAALLAGLPQAPSRLRPDRHPQRAARRRDYVLGRMAACGYITAEQMTRARSEPVVCTGRPPAFRAPHFCELVRASSPRERTLRTTLDNQLQSAAEEMLQNRAGLLAGQGIDGGAIVVLEVGSGAVRALVGSPDFWNSGRSGQVNGALARRSPGSALKPFLYALAIDQGLCTPATVVGDVPLVLPGYRPENFDREFCGLVSVREALVKSLNIPALKMTQQVGQENFVGLLREAGLRTLDKPAEHYGLGIALGGGEVTLLDLVNAYACLARLGEYRPVCLLETEPLALRQPSCGGPRSRLRDHSAASARRPVVDASGNPGRDTSRLSTGSPRPSMKLFSEEAAFLVADILSGDERAFDVCGHAADVRRPRVAWKTGTSAGFRDAWTIAYNPEYVVGIWLGNPDGRRSPALVGREIAAPMVYEIFRRLYPRGDAPWFSAPKGVDTRVVCARSGLAPSDRCEATVVDLSISGVSSLKECGIHQRQPDGRLGELWPPEIESYLRSHGMQVQPPGTSLAAGVLRITSPLPGVTYKRLPGLDRVKQEIPLAAVTDAAAETIFWFVDGELFDICKPDHAIFWPIRSGAHVVACSDSLGRHDTASIFVE